MGKYMFTGVFGKQDANFKMFLARPS